MSESRLYENATYLIDGHEVTFTKEQKLWGTIWWINIPGRGRWWEFENYWLSVVRRKPKEAANV